VSAPQLPLALSPPRRQDFGNFVPGANAAVVATLRHALEAGQWYLLTGPSGTGKSHLAAALEKAWRDDGRQVRYIPGRTAAALLASDGGGADDTDGILVEDIDRLAGDPVAERALFNALNRWRPLRATVLMSARGMPDFGLPDLASRVAQAARLRLKPLGEDALDRLIEQLVSDFELVVGRGVGEYLLRHGPRSPDALVALFGRLARRAAAERRRVSVPLARQCLSGSG